MKQQTKCTIVYWLCSLILVVLVSSLSLIISLNVSIWISVLFIFLVGFMSAPTGDMFFAAGIVTILAIICAMKQLDYFMLLPGAFAGFLSLLRPEVDLIMGKIYPPLNEPPEDS